MLNFENNSLHNYAFQKSCRRRLIHNRTLQYLEFKTVLKKYRNFHKEASLMTQNTKGRPSRGNDLIISLPALNIGYNIPLWQGMHAA